MTIRFDEKWKNTNKDNFYIIQKEKLMYDRNIGFWRDIVVRVYKTILPDSIKPVFIVEYGAKMFPESRVFSTKTNALKFAREYMKKI